MHTVPDGLLNRNNILHNNQLGAAKKCGAFLVLHCRRQNRRSSFRCIEMTDAAIESEGENAVFREVFIHFLGKY